MERQCEAIAVYAARRGLTIVKSYKDAGRRSGTAIDRRTSFQGLPNDLMSGRFEYTTVVHLCPRVHLDSQGVP